MGSERKKIKYYEEGPYGTLTERTLYARMNHTCDVTTFYDEDGEYIFSYGDTIDNNLFDAMIELSCPIYGKRQHEIENMNEEDRKKCNI